MTLGHCIHSYTCKTLLIAVLTLSCAPAMAQPQDEPAAFDPQAVQPTARLQRALETKPTEPDLLKRWSLALERVIATVKPAEMPKPDAEAQLTPLSQEAQRMLEQADKLIERGDLFSAIRLLREAEITDPDQPAVQRRLGLAYSLSGNQLRGAGYLEQSLKHEPGNAVALLLLCQHYAQRGQVDRVLAFNQALRKVGVPGVLSDRCLAQALEHAGYITASVDALDRCIKGLSDLPKQDDTDAFIRRELRVLQATRPELMIGLGDLQVALGRIDAAEKTYARIDLEQASDSAALLGRRVFIALRKGDIDTALTLSGQQLARSDGGASGRSAIGYLRTQGISRKRIAAAMEAQMQKGGTSLALLSGLAEVAEPDRVIKLAVVWLASGTQNPRVYGEVAGLADFDDSDPQDAKPLALLLEAALGEMRRTPDSARQYVEAVVGQIDAPICMLRAIKQPKLAQDQDAFALLLKAVVFEEALRSKDAVEQYEQALALEPVISDQIRVPLARLQIERDQARDAIKTLEPMGVPTEWEAFEVMVMAVAEAGQPSTAIQFVDNWRRARGGDLSLSLLRARLLAKAGNPSRACNDIFNLIHQNPEELRVYEAGLDLIQKNIDRFHSFNQAANLRAGVVNLLQSNMPDAPRSRIERAIDIYSHPQRSEEAIKILQLVTKEEPDNTLAWLVLESIYQNTGDDDAADAAHRAWFKADIPSLGRVLVSAERAVTNGEMQRASSMLRRMLKLEEEGVLPGPAMTDADAGVTIELLTAAEPDKDLETFSLKMVRRFPASVQLNNSLGYQWTVQDKNLLQAKAMIERAIANGTPNHAVLDSLAWVQYKLGQYEQAAQTQKRALEVLEKAKQLVGDEQLKGSKAVLNDHMGDIQFRNGDENAAVRHWQIALGVRIDEEDMMRDPELRTIGRRTLEKLKALADGKEPPVTPVPGPEAHGQAGHPADLKPAE